MPPPAYAPLERDREFARINSLRLGLAKQRVDEQMARHPQLAGQGQAFGGEESDGEEMSGQGLAFGQAFGQAFGRAYGHDEDMEGSGLAAGLHGGMRLGRVMAERHGGSYVNDMIRGMMVGSGQYSSDSESDEEECEEYEGGAQNFKQGFKELAGTSQAEAFKGMLYLKNKGVAAEPGVKPQTSLFLSSKRKIKGQRPAKRSPSASARQSLRRPRNLPFWKHQQIVGRLRSRSSQRRRVLVVPQAAQQATPVASVVR